MSDKILVVDDDPEILELVQTVLEFSDFETDIISKASGAIDALQRQSYTMLIIDLVMDVSGLEVVQAIRDNPKLEKLEVLVMSSKILTPEEVDGIHNLNAYYMSKPFNTGQLVEKVQEILAR